MSKLKNIMPATLSNTSLYLIKALFFSALVTATLSSSTQAAEQEWWFDVEVILFDRKLNPEDVTETFTQSTLKQSNSAALDLLTPYLTPDLSYIQAGLPFCRESRILAEKEKYAQAFALPDPVTDTASLHTEELEVANSESENQGHEDKNFAYQVVTDDIFTEQKPTTTVPNDTLQNVTIPFDTSFFPIEWQLPKQFPCVYAEQVEPSLQYLLSPEPELPVLPLATLKHIPVEISGIEWFTKHAAFLLPRESLRMTDLYTSIKKQKGLTPLLHLAWRQEVMFENDNPQQIRLFAGKNYSESFDILGLPNKGEQQSTTAPYIPKQEFERLTEAEQQAWLQNKLAIESGESLETVDLFHRIEQALLDETPIKTNINDIKVDTNVADISDLTSQHQIWQLDGKLKVYLKNIGRVPYLHINTNLHYRQPIYTQSADNVQNLSELTDSINNTAQLPLQTNYLQSVNFEQLRRVISKQVHYFDHPLFGMIVLINRYKWPVEPIEEETP